MQYTMCGILAVVDFNDKLDQDLLIRMRDTMYHRGPDDAGIHANSRVGIAHRRLAIIDLSSAAHQPMSNEDGTIMLVYNGEIYNYLELRKNLIRQGHKFHSESDSEVIIHQYEEDGETCLDKLNGMFAFVLWDVKRKKLFGARDRLGIKPLYFFANDKKIILASEIKAIIKDPDIPRLPDYQAIADYLFAGRALRSKTMFRGIKEIEPGYMVSVDTESRTVINKKYWDIAYHYDYSRKTSTVIEELSCLVNDAVKLHCRSDASLGCHLSGGMDSSAIVALASKYRSPLKTFSIKFSNDINIDETQYAKAVAHFVGADYHESSPTHRDLRDLLPFLMWYMDVPTSTDGGFSYFTVSKLASKYVKVSLTGHGGDELFAGYPAQFKAAFKNADMFNLPRKSDCAVKRSLLRKIIDKYFLEGTTGFYKSVKKRTAPINTSFEDHWILLHCGYLPSDNPALHSRFKDNLEGYCPRDDYVAPFAAADTNEILDLCLYHDLKVYLPALLHLEDRVSMALSIESRVPLLDYRIVEFLATVPPEQKVQGGQPKYLLRALSSSILPEKVLSRKDKFPFPVPKKFWTSHEMRDMARAILLSESSLGRGIFKPYALKRACESAIASPWSMINTELWFKIFIDQDIEWLDKAHSLNIGNQDMENSDHVTC